MNEVPAMRGSLPDCALQIVARGAKPVTCNVPFRDANGFGNQKSSMVSQTDYAELALGIVRYWRERADGLLRCRSDIAFREAVGQGI